MTSPIAENTVHQMDALDLLRQLPEASVDCVLTDPPYGTTQAEWDTMPDLQALWIEYRRVVREGGAVIMTASQPFTSVLVSSQPNAFRHEWIWEKDNGSNFLNANREPFKTHESVLVFGFSGVNYWPVMETGYTAYRARHRASSTVLYGSHGETETVSDGQRFPRSVLRFASNRSLHPTQKPVALFEYLIRTYTRPGDLVVDPFGGSGTTAVAARNLGRRYITGDTDAGYCEIMRRRLSEPYTPQMFAETDAVDDAPVQAELFSHEEAI